TLPVDRDGFRRPPTSSPHGASKRLDSYHATHPRAGPCQRRHRRARDRRARLMWRFTSHRSQPPRPASRRRAPATRKAPRAACKLQVELLEDRTVPATLTPTTFADGTGPGTLRNAIAQANSNNQDNTIVLAPGTYTLSPAFGGELAVTGVGHALTIQGSGQTIIHAGG